MEVRVDMMERRNPAVVAGLLGGVVLTNPCTALALSGQSASSFPVAPFVIGAAGGALVAGSVAGVAFLVSTHASGRRGDAKVGRETVPTHLAGKEAGSDAANEVERAHVIRGSGSERDAGTAGERPRHAFRMDERATKAKAGEAVASAHPARHMSAAEWERSGVIRVRGIEASAAPGKGSRTTTARQRAAVEDRPRTSRLAAAPVAEADAGPAPEPLTSENVPVRASLSNAKADHVARDYGDIAENYVHRETLRNRMTSRAQGVASVLRDRIGSNRMDGLPVITRPDGSVGDVGTGWWTRAVGSDAIAGRVAFVDDDAIPSDFTDLSMLSMPAMPSYESLSASESLSSCADAERAVRATRSQAILNRVAFVDEGIYPEKRSVEDVESDDVWESALTALDERIAAQSPAAQGVASFSDTVGGSDTIDEPDGMAADTQFIPFRTPAGHPEVIDTDTYVNYLIGEEFSRNSSNAVRRTSRDFLRMIEGGTSSTSRHLSTDETPPRRGRHFAKAEPLSVAFEA